VNDSVAVVIPTFNRLRLLQDAVASVRTQRSPVQEIVVVDDGSTDQTQSWCLQQKDVKYLNCHRQGPSAARNLGAQHVRSTWIAFLDSDDVWLEDHISTARSVFAKESESSWLISNCIITDKDLHRQPGVQGIAAAFPVFRNSPERFATLFPYDHQQQIWRGGARAQALQGNWLQPSGLLIRRELFLSVGGFNERLWRCEDMDLLFRLVTREQATLSLKQTYCWRQGQENSLASDSAALLLKWGGLKVLLTLGLRIPGWSIPLWWIWLISTVRFTCDLLKSSTLRCIRHLESIPLAQTSLQASQAVMNLLLPLIVARVFSRSDYAAYRTFTLFLSTSAALSLTSGFWSLIPYWGALGRQGLSLRRSAWILQLICALLYATVIFIFAPIQAGHDSAGLNLGLASCVVLLLPAVFLEQLLCAENRGTLASLLVLAVEAGKSICVLWIAFFRPSVHWIVAVTSFFICVRVFVLWLCSWQVKVLPKTAVDRWSLQAVAKQAWPIGLAAAISMLIGTGDRIFLSQFLSSNVFAGITAGCLALPFAGILEQTLMQRGIPRIARSIANSELHSVKEVLRDAIARILCFSLTYSFAMCLFATEIVDLIFVNKYPDAASVLRVFVWGNLACCIPFDALARAQGLSMRIFKFSLQSLPAVGLLMFLSFAAAGPLGVVFAGVFSLVVSRLVFFLIELKRCHIKWTDVVPERVVGMQILTTLAALSGLKYLLFANAINLFVTFSLVCVCLVSSLFVLPNLNFFTSRRSSKEGVVE